MSEKKKDSSGFGNLPGSLSGSLTELQSKLQGGGDFGKPSADSKLVYSTDPTLNQKCEKCRELQSECRCVKDVNLKGYRFVAVLRMEKKGRGGKTVTVIDQLPKNEIFLKEWTVKLKRKCGSGGTYLMDGKEGIIEIQGDHRDRIRKIFQDEGIKSKG